MDMKLQQMEEVSNKYENLHCLTGSKYSNTCKLRALMNMECNELTTIYNLVESHAPNLRITAATRYEKAVGSQSNVLSLNQSNLNLNCSVISTDDKIKHMLNQVGEMPKEWTVVQLTSQFSKNEYLEIDEDKCYTSAIYLTVFNCGSEDISPFTISVDPPIDEVNGSCIEIRQEMHSILMENKNRFESIKSSLGKFLSQAVKQQYLEARFSINNRLQDLVRQIQNKWLAEWRCLLMGKFIDEKLENIIKIKIESILRNENHVVPDKTKNLLKYLIKTGNMLKITELKSALRYLFSEEHHKALRISFTKMAKDLDRKYNFIQQSRHPLILIVDEKLDFLPWEMLDILEDQPVSRMPSLHFTYALFKEHESTISGGYKIITNAQNATYIVNPSLDLQQMEVRLSSFFKYWVPNWTGLIGVTPSETEFQEKLTNTDIFVYSGHGNGTQYLSGDKIQKLRVNAVVFLFGCGSISLHSLGPQVEMYSSYHMYLIACSPCVLGMLWAVTDIDTDTLTTELFSLWVPSTARTNWELVDRKIWEATGILKFGRKKGNMKEPKEHEPDLLRAVCKAKKAAKQYMMKAACVVRGLPVKLS